MKKLLLLTTAFVALQAAPLVAQEDRIPDERDVIGLLESQAEGAMDLQTILKAAYDSNPTIQAARAQLKSVEESKGIATADFLPSIDANAAIEHSNTDTEPGGTDNLTARSASVDLAQPVFRGGSTIANLRQTNELINAARAGVVSIENQVLYLTAQAYMDVLRDEALVKLNINNRKLLARQLKATRDRFDVGDLTRTDVAQAEFRLARADADLTAAEGNLRTSRAVFEQMVGYPPKGLRLPKIAFDFPETVDEAAAMAEKNNPVVHGAMFEHNAALDEISSIRGELLPQITLQGSLSKAYDPSSSIDESRDGTIGLVASMPLYEGGGTRARVRQAREQANQRRIEITETERSAHQRATSAFESLAAARAEIRSRQAQVKAAEIARGGVRQEAELGSRTILDTLDADQEVLDAQTALVNAKRNEVVAQFALAAALGLLTPENLAFLADLAGDKAR